jgi:hypothetical protein
MIVKSDDNGTSDRANPPTRITAAARIPTVRQETSTDLTCGGKAVPDSGLNLRVDKDHVLAVRDSLRDRVADFENQARSLLGHAHVPNIGEDPVSKDATAAWNHRLFEADDSHLARMRAYVHALNELVDRLTETATRYGLTEKTNTDTMNRGDG